VEYEYGYGYDSILENILNITPSGVIVGHVWGGGYRYGY
jgi:hypothetical protein